MQILLIAVPSGEVHRTFLIPSEELKGFNMGELDDMWCDDPNDPPLSDLWDRLDDDLKKYEDPPMPCNFDQHYVIGSL